MYSTMIAATVCAGLVVTGVAIAQADSRSAGSNPTSVSEGSAATGGRPHHNTAEVAVAARAYLRTLSSEQRRRTVLDSNDPARKAGWSNLPNIVFERKGVPLAS